MSKKSILKCISHDLKFEYPADWSEQKISPPTCPLCIDAELTRLSEKYIKIKQQRDTLLSAIEVKISVEVDSFNA